MASELETSERGGDGEQKGREKGGGRKNEDSRLLFSLINLEELTDSVHV